MIEHSTVHKNRCSQFNLFVGLGLLVLLVLVAYRVRSCGKTSRENAFFDAACRAIAEDSPSELKVVILKAPDVVAMRDGFDQSTLMHRISTRRLQNGCEMAELLIEHGADANAKDATGATPLDLALRFNAPENYVAFLKSKVSAAGAEPGDSFNPLEWRSFHTEEADWRKERTGFRDGAGNIMIPARFLDADCAFFEGFAWVNTEVCDATKDHPDVPYAGPFDMEACGNFIDTKGRPLLSIHAHTVHEPDPGFGMQWQIWPRFNHGLAFVRLADGLVYGVTTNGTTLPCHEALGSFAPLRGRGCDEEPYWLYRGDWALVGLQDGRAGILGPDHAFAVGPSEDVAEIEALWKDGLKRLDPFDFEGANSTPWLRVRLKFDDSATMMLGYLLQVLEKRSYECLYPTIDKYGYLHPHYLIMDAEWGLKRKSVHVPAGDHTVRTLLEMAAEQTGAFPLLTRFSAVFIDLPQYPRDKDGPVVLPFRTKPSGLLSESPSADP